MSISSDWVVGEAMSKMSDGWVSPMTKRKGRGPRPKLVNWYDRVPKRELRESFWDRYVAPAIYKRYNMAHPLTSQACMFS